MRLVEIALLFAATALGVAWGLEHARYNRTIDMLHRAQLGVDACVLIIGRQEYLLNKARRVMEEEISCRELRWTSHD